jgi:hypothetical protein
MIARRLATALLFAVLPASAAQPDLEVTATYPEESTGTMHYSTRLTLSVDGAEPLVIEGDLGPIPGPHFRLPDARFLLVGWSSTGAGMQRTHVMLVSVRSKSVGLDDELTLNTDRGSAGVLLRFEPGGSIRIGLPEPPREYAFSEDEWFLNVGKKSLDLAQMRKLPFRTIRPRKDDFFYYGVAARQGGPDRVAWIDITPKGFRLPVR